MSDTPRVDKAIDVHDDRLRRFATLLTCARQLERELDAERQRILDRVQLMREGEADADLRCLIAFIRNP